MAKPFKFRYVNEIVGTFVLLVVALLIAGILLAGHAQDWFTPTYRLTVDFPPEGSLGLQKDAAVEILGTAVGKVERIQVEEDGNMSGVVTIKGDFYRFVREDSRVIVKKRFGVAGDAYIEITKGQGPLLEPDTRLAAGKDTELTEMLAELVKQVREVTVPALEELRRTVAEYGQLAADLRNPDAALMQLLGNLEAITGGLKQGEGAAGKLLRDPEMADDVRVSLDTIRAALEDLKRTTAQLPPMARTVGGEVADLPGMVLQTQETIREAERLIEGIQRHWLIRGNIAQPEPSALIPAAEVRVK